MIKNLNEILKEWAYRVDNGQPNPKNSAHLYHLSEILIEYKWPFEVIEELLQNLNEDDIVKKKQSDGSYGSPYTVKNHNPDRGQELVKKDASPEDIKSVEKGEEPKDKKPKKDSDNVGDELTNFKRYLSDEQKKALELSDNMRVKQLEKLDDMADSFKNLPPEVRNTSSTLFAKGLIYQGRPNSGIGKNRLGYLEVKNLSENKEYLLEAYGDGSPKKVKEFVKNSRKIKVSEEYVDASFDLLPKKLQSALNGKGKVGDAGKNNHFLGYTREDGSVTSDKSDSNIKKDENGKLVVKRGNPGNKSRGQVVWRCILEQGGQDPYTGLPLDLNNIDLEHVVAFDNKDNGEPTSQDYLDREHDDNIVICSTNVNQKKSNLSMKNFLEKNVETQKDKSEEDFKQVGKAYEDVNKISSHTKQTAQLLLDEGNLREYDYKTLSETFSLDDETYDSAKEQFKKVAKNKRDQKKISTLKSQIGKDTIMAMGLNRGLTDKTGRRTVKLSSDNLYRGFLLSLSENPERTEEFKKEWDNARKVGNSDEYRLKGKGQQGMIKYLIDKEIISKKVLDDPKLGKVFKNALNEVYDYELNDYFIGEVI